MVKTREELQGKTSLLRENAPVEWLISKDLVDYETSVAEMEKMAALIAKGESRERIWLLEHPPLYTAGSSANSEDLKAPDALPVFQTGRGGQYTYHGPGQRIAYVMLDLNKRKPDVRAFVCALEEWIINTLKELNITAERREKRVGVWVARPDLGREDKIAAIGIRVKKWVTLHGISLNIEPDLTHYEGIVPCGIAGHGITSIFDLGQIISMAEVDAILRAEFEKIFGPTELI